MMPVLITNAGVHKTFDFIPVCWFCHLSSEKTGLAHHYFKKIELNKAKQEEEATPWADRAASLYSTS